MRYPRAGVGAVFMAGMSRVEQRLLVEIGGLSDFTLQTDAAVSHGQDIACETGKVAILVG